MRAFGNLDRGMRIRGRTRPSSARRCRPLFETLERRGMLSATVDSLVEDGVGECLVVPPDPGAHEWKEPTIMPDEFGIVVCPIVAWEPVEFADVPADLREDGLEGFEPAEPCTDVNVDVDVMFSCMGASVSEPDAADVTERAGDWEATVEASSDMAVVAMGDVAVADTGSIRRDMVHLPTRVHQDLAAVAVWFTTVNTGGGDAATTPVGKRRTR